MNNKYLELKEKLTSQSNIELQKKFFELAQKFTNPTDKVKSVLNDNLVNQFEEKKIILLLELLLKNRIVITMCL